MQFTFNGQDMFEIFFTHADRQMWESSMPWPITEVKIKIVYYIQFLLSKKFCDIYFAISNEHEIGKNGPHVMPVIYYSTVIFNGPKKLDCRRTIFLPYIEQIIQSLRNSNGALNNF